MTGSASLAFPGGRTLTAWWRQLASYQPECFWVGYVTCHHIETLVSALRDHKLPPLELFVLKALASQSRPLDANSLSDWLYLDAALIQRLLHHLQREGLLTWQDAGAASLSEAGRRCVTSGAYAHAHQERRALYFWLADWRTPSAPRFVHLPHANKIAWLTAPDTPFALESAHQCLLQGPQWKQRYGFPADISEILTNPARGGWEQVAVATPQRFFAAVVRTPAEQGALLVAFAVNSRNWELHAAQPAFAIPDDEPDWFPPPLSTTETRQAFVEWCRQRQLPDEEAERCNLVVEQYRLRTEAPLSWRDKLQTGRPEAWLLAGDGNLRCGLRLEVQ